MIKPLTLLFFCLIMFSCQKKMAGCLRNEISDFDDKNQCATARVDEYLFQGRTVYVFEPGQCGADMTSAVIDDRCNHLGYLGGFMGNTVINGESFSSAVFQKTIWKK